MQRLRSLGEVISPSAASSHALLTPLAQHGKVGNASIEAAAAAILVRRSKELACVSSSSRTIPISTVSLRRR
jgi:hypothetical protein